MLFFGMPGGALSTLNSWFTSTKQVSCTRVIKQMQLSHCMRSITGLASNGPVKVASRSAYTCNEVRFRSNNCERVRKMIKQSSYFKLLLSVHLCEAAYKSSKEFQRRQGRS